MSHNTSDKIGFKKEDIKLLLQKDTVYGFDVQLYSVFISEKKKGKGQPLFKVDKSIKEFNSVKSGTLVKEVYSVKNEGDAPLNLLDISPTCNCVSVKADSEIIMPNEETTIQVVFDTSGRKGYQRKTIIIMTNDSLHPYIQLQLNGKVISN